MGPVDRRPEGNVCVVGRDNLAHNNRSCFSLNYDVGLRDTLAGSSVEERVAVNHYVAGSIPALPALLYLTGI